MKYFVTLLGTVFLLFVGLVFYGWTLPQTFVFERSTTVGSNAEDIYTEIADIESLRAWAPYIASLGFDETAITGSERGSGQIVHWRRSLPPFQIGVQEILALTPPYFVQSRFSSEPYDGSIIYALNQGLPTEKVTVLVRLDLDAGGFPYFDRVKLRLKQNAVNDELSQSLVRLKTIAEL